MPHRATTSADYERRVLRAQRFLADRLDEPIDPAALARAAAFSLHHFHRIFRAQMGETVMQHVRRLRLERAARKLRGDDAARLVDLALEAGYESHEAFTRAFIERFGMPPSRFRDEPSARLAAWQASGAGAGPSAPIRVEHCPEIRVAFTRHRGGYMGVHETWARMRAWAEARGLLAASPAPLYGLCPDDPDVTAEEYLRFDICVAVDESFHPSAGDELAIEVERIPAGTYAVGLHTGPYDRLSETYLDVIGRWFPTSGYEPAPDDAVVEHYLNDLSSAPPAELRTEVRVKIAD